MLCTNLKMENLIYYLDTSAIYNLRKVKESDLSLSFYSALNLIEMVAGITSENFSKRKALLTLLLQSPATYDPRFPEQLMFESFDCFIEYEYLEQRATDLLELVRLVTISEDVSEFYSQEKAIELSYPLQSFIDLDQQWSRLFFKASSQGKEQVAECLNSTGENNSIEYEGGNYHLSDRRSIINFLKIAGVNRSITILALANAAMKTGAGAGIQMAEQKVYESYNGLLDYFLDAMDAYSVDLMIDNKSPQKNDAQDLMHTFYLRGNSNQKIVSLDNIFLKCLPQQTIPLSEIVNS